MIVVADEKWRDVEGFPGHYAVSDQGRVKSLARVAPRVCCGRPRPQTVAERILRPGKDKSGYLVVRLGGKTQRVHSLVANAFIGPRPSHLEICHNNGVKTDNRSSNLRYDTHRANMADRVRHARARGFEFKGRPRKLTTEQMAEVSALVPLKSKAEIGRLYGVSRATVSRAALEIEARQFFSHER